MGPSDRAPDTPPSDAMDAEQARIAQRNAFYESLSPEAKERFLDALTLAREHGLDEEASWKEAVIAAELAYAPDADERPMSGDAGMPPAGP
jgi:hypothetical protein